MSDTSSLAFLAVNCTDKISRTASSIMPCRYMPPPITPTSFSSVLHNPDTAGRSRSQYSIRIPEHRRTMLHTVFAYTFKPFMARLDAMAEYDMDMDICMTSAIVPGGSFVLIRPVPSEK